MQTVQSIEVWFWLNVLRVSGSTPGGDDDISLSKAKPLNNT